MPETENKSKNNRLVAIDLGNGNLKIRTIAGTFIGPSQYIRSFGPRIPGTQNVDDILEFSFPELGSEKYLWGTDLGNLKSLDQAIDTRSFKGRYQQESYKKMFLIALAYAVNKDPFHKSSYTVEIVGGMPTDDAKSEANREAVRNALVGTHDVVVEGTPYSITVETQDNVKLLPQAVGTLIDLAYDKTGNQIHPEFFSTGRTTLVDFGTGTILYDQFVAGRHADSSMQTRGGAFKIAEEVARQANEISKFDVEFKAKDVFTMFNNHQDNTPYIIQKNKMIKQNVTSIVQGQIDQVTKDIIAQLKDIPEWDTSDNFVVTGGGSHLVNHKILDQFLQTKGLSATYIENPLTANVNGFYKYVLSVSDFFKRQEEAIQKEKA